MEVLSDFGAVQHFSIPTFTTGIFKTWEGLYDLNSAMQLASILLIFITIFIVVERTSRKNALYSPQSSNFKPTKIIQLKGMYNFIAFFFCLIPIIVGFLLPVSELLFWAFSYNESFFSEQFVRTSLNTFFISIVAAITCVLLALLVNFSIRIKNNRSTNFLSSLLTIGYGIPGLILAIGIVQLTASLGNLLNVLLVGSLFGLLIAYLVKSYALANLSIEAGFSRISKKYDDSARTLKSTGWHMLFNIHLPLLKGSVLTATLLVFAEIVKELPATLILRPFNFDTLAVSTYLYAAEERMYEAAAPAISIVLIGLIPIIFITKMIRDSKPVK